jgi:integrative and conjugative element protein (TIGR02256 family)
MKSYRNSGKKWQGTLLIKPETLSLIEEEASRAKTTETGGVIAGRGDFESGIVLVEEASDAGPNAIKRCNFFSRDTKYCQAVLDMWASETDGEVDYLGEWHKHHQKEPRPSAEDIRTMRRIAASPQYHVRTALLLIIGESNSRDHLRAFLVDKDGNFQVITWQDSATQRFESNQKK